MTQKFGKIDWVHELAIEWGAYLRTYGNPFHTQNILDVMVRGVNYGSVELDEKAEESEPEVLSFHRAFLRLPEVNQNVVYVMYVPIARIEDKVSALNELHGLSKSKVYEIRNQSHSQIWGYIDAHIQMQENSFPEKQHSGNRL